MQRILIVKTSSMGDVIHNLPVITDIQQQIPGALIDWVAEESFAEIPALHPGVRKVISVSLRRWRKSLFTQNTIDEIRTCINGLQNEHYDIVLDTQGLIKSAVIAKLSRGEPRGYTWNSAREPLATLLYRRRFFVDKEMHAVQRNRQLSAKALDYSLDNLSLNYGIELPTTEISPQLDKPYAVLLHATSRNDKLWPEDNWIALGKHLSTRGLNCELVWGNTIEKRRSERLAHAIPNSRVQNTLSLREAAFLLSSAAIVIGVDTGLTHLAAALDKNVVALYTATVPGYTGVYGGANAINLGTAGHPPTVDDTWNVISTLIDGTHVT